ncbi:MAG TPA: hypothetical protein VKU01_07280 [Bryobacteraceae bacterium]|nr:hypothetical protein [Bryobacteraceae bacterium]
MWCRAARTKSASEWRRRRKAAYRLDGAARSTRARRWGLAIVLICAWSVISTIKSFVFGKKPADPLAMLLAAGILIAALVLAGFAPHRCWRL